MSDPRLEWPMESYLAAWKTFRRLSDENEVLAKHLFSRASWPQGQDVSICDLGCGDGRLLEQVVIKGPNRVSKVTLVDPDPSLLEEAKNCIFETSLVETIVEIESPAEQAFPECAQDSDIILMIHVVYLLDAGYLEEILAKLPIGKPLFVIFDAPTSVFYSLWEATAPKYHARVKAAHQLLEKLSGNQGLSITRSEAISRIKNPLDITRQDLRAAVLSLLCYCSLRNLPAGISPEWIESVLKQHGQNGHIICTSSCYEIVRTH